MAKSKITQEDEDLLAELGFDDEVQEESDLSSEQERLLAGFEEIERFYETQKRMPQQQAGQDIFERLYAVRLEALRKNTQARAFLSTYDKHGLLESEPNEHIELDDDALLAELGLDEQDENDITQLKFVKTRAEINAAEEIAKRTPCADFNTFKPLFTRVNEELKTYIRFARRFKEDASIQKQEFFILGGQIAYVAEKGEEFKASNGSTDARLRVIFDNGTESDLLLRSLQRALYKDETGRRITNPSAGALFDNVREEEDIESGTIYILRSKSEHEFIKANKDVIHKIGVTSGDVSKRIVNAQNDPTFLMADVEVIATYELANINRVKLENLIHRFFEPAKLNIEILDRFGKPITPREWFLVPLFIINDAIEKIKDGSIVHYSYDATLGKIIGK